MKLFDKIFDAYNWTIESRWFMYPMAVVLYLIGLHLVGII